MEKTGGNKMKITEVTKTLTWYVKTDDPDYPVYRTTDEFGENWENYLGGIWNPVFYPQDKELKELFLDYMKNKKEETK
jgi:hypothetical protein